VSTDLFVESPQHLSEILAILHKGAFQKSLPALPRLSLKSPHVAENWAHSRPVLGDLKGAIGRLLARCPTNLRESPPIRPPNKGRRRLLKRTSVDLHFDFRDTGANKSNACDILT